MSVWKSENWHVLQYGINYIENAYRELLLFLRKIINQTQFWYTFLAFFSTAFIHETNCSIALLICTRSFAQIFQTDIFFKFSFWCKRFSKSSFVNLCLNKVQIKIIQWIFIGWRWRPFFGTDETTFNFVLIKSCTKSDWWDGAQSFAIAGNNSLCKFC